MKYKFTLFVMLVLSLFACKKDNNGGTTKPDGKLYPISFNVTGFSQTYVPVTSITSNKKTTAVDTIPITDLAFLLFNSAGETAKIIRVTKTTSGFGAFKENVPAGNYTAVFVGGPSSFLLTADGKNLTYSNYWGDTFYKKIPVTVNASSVSQDVELSRLTGQLSLNIADAIPADIKRIRIAFNDTAIVKTLTGIKQDIYQNGAIVNFAAADAGKINYRIIMNTLNNVMPFTVTVYVYKSDLNKPAITKVINNVVCKTNVRTILSGNLFAPGNTSFTVSIDNIWNTPVTTEF